MSTKIAITYEKGGCAKTTTSVNLAALLAERQYRVLLIDLDFQSYATSYYDLYDEQLPSILDVMQGNTPIEKAIRQSDVENLFILPAVTAFKKIETELMMKTRQQEYTLKTALLPIEMEYDFILIDCPPNGDRIKTNAEAAADYLILPTIPDDYAIHGLLCMAQELLEIKQYVNRDLEVLGVLIALYEKTNNKEAYANALEKQDVFPCFSTRIRKNTTLSEAINAHKPINHYNRKCNGFTDYNLLTNEILLKLEVRQNGN